MKVFSGFVAAVVLLGLSFSGAKVDATFMPPDLFTASSAPSKTPTAAPSDSPSPSPTDSPTPAPVATVRRTPAPTPPPAPQYVRVSGTVMATNGYPAPGVTAVVYRADNGAVVGSGVSNQSGVYSASVPKNGTYKLYFNGPGVYPKWYTNADSFAKATQIAVGNVDTTGINIVLPKR